MNQSSDLRVQRPEPVVNQVYQALRQALLQGQFTPGQRLKETELAEMFGVSRTPVREALSKLEVEGLVESLPVGGVAVRDIEAELAEIYGLRQRLEGYAAALAAERISDEELDALDAARAEALEAIDQATLEERAELNNVFHRLLIEASHSPRLIRLSHDYRDYFLNERMLQFYDRETALRHHRQHQEIVDSLRARDSERAERLLRDHFESALQTILTTREELAEERGTERGEARGEGEGDAR